MLGQFFQFHYALVGEDVGRVEPRNIRNDWPAAGVDENFFRFQKGFTHLDLARIRESGLPLVETYVGMQPDLSLDSAAEARDDFVFLRDDCRKIHGHIIGAHSPTRGMPRVVRDLRTMNHGLRGRAPCIDTSAAHVALFDQGDFPS